MKTNFKVFIGAFVIFSLFIGSAIFAFDKYYYTDFKIEQSVEIDGEEETTDDTTKTKLQLLEEDDDRINILLFGIDGARADTIMVVSYEYEKKILDVISIPRDTYIDVPGFDAQGQNKINAVYGFAGEQGGSLGLKSIISDMLGIEIDYYVKIKYEGVKAVVEVLGGIEVDVPFDMKYDDPFAEPELHIDLKEGLQILDGEKAMEYLRWRKNNDEAGEGDLPRIERQQEFLKLAVKKSLSYKLPAVANTVFEYIKTDIKLDKLIYYSTKAIGFSMDNLNVHRIPGKVSNDGSGFYIHDPDETEKMLIEIFN